MKKIFIVLFIFLLLPQLFAYTISETDFVGAKGQLLYAYRTLESNTLQISLLFEQKATKMSQAEQTVFHIIRGDLELGMFVVKDVLALYTLQAVQLSTPPEAVKLLTDACLDTTDFLNKLQERLIDRKKHITDKAAKNIVEESLSVIDTAKEAILILQKFTEARKAFQP